MNKWLIAIIIGVVQSLSIGLIHFFTELSIIIGPFICLVMGLLTVVFIRERVNIYALGAVLSGVPVNILAFGSDDGLIVTFGITFIYGIIFVQLFQATDVAIDNVRYVSEVLYKRMIKNTKKMR